MAGRSLSSSVCISRVVYFCRGNSSCVCSMYPFAFHADMCVCDFLCVQHTISVRRVCVPMCVSMSLLLNYMCICYAYVCVHRVCFLCMHDTMCAEICVNRSCTYACCEHQLCLQVALHSCSLPDTSHLWKQSLSRERRRVPTPFLGRADFQSRLLGDSVMSVLAFPFAPSV